MLVIIIIIAICIIYILLLQLFIRCACANASEICSVLMVISMLSTSERSDGTYLCFLHCDDLELNSE